MSLVLELKSLVGVHENIVTYIFVVGFKDPSENTDEDVFWGGGIIRKTTSQPHHLEGRQGGLQKYSHVTHVSRGFLEVKVRKVCWADTRDVFA